MNLSAKSAMGLEWSTGNTPARVPAWNGLNLASGLNGILHLMNCVKSSMASFMAQIAKIVKPALSLTKVLAIFAAFVGAGLSCMAAVSQPPEPTPVMIDVVEAGTTRDLPQVEYEVPLCLRRDHIVLQYDGGVFEYNTPRPCLPLYKYREIGDPQP